MQREDGIIFHDNYAKITVTHTKFKFIKICKRLSPNDKERGDD